LNGQKLKITGVYGPSSGHGRGDFFKKLKKKRVRKECHGWYVETLT
jgi:hypothetical protein